MFQLQTVLTTRCNLNCKYCYMKVNDGSKDMTLADFEQALSYLDDIKKALKYRNVTEFDYDVAFFGGEPLLNLKEMISIADYTRGICQRTICHTPTNGICLDDKTVDILDKNKIAYNLSYDGPYFCQRTSNERVSFKNFNTVVRSMQKRGVKCMISPQNVSMLYKNFKYFVDNDIYYPGIAIVRDNQWTTGHIDIFDKQLNVVSQYIDYVYKDKGILCIPELFSLPILDTVLGKKKGKRPFSCFSGVTGVAIFGNGDIYPCARFGSNKRFKLGNYKEKSFDYENIEFIRNLKVIGNDNCIGCSLYEVCNMQCKFSELQNGNWKTNKPIQEVCSLYKIIYKHAYKVYDKYKRDPNYIDYLNNKLRG